MYFGQKEINFWPAFADILFLLFVLVMVAGSNYIDVPDNLSEAQEKIKELLTKIVSLEDENQRLIKENDALKEITKNGELKCGIAEDFLIRVKIDLDQVGIGSSIKDCGLQLEESLLYEFGSAQLKDPVKARQLLRIIIEHADDLIQTSPGAIDTIAIGGHADCRGSSESNYFLGAQRAMSLYNLAKQIIINEDYTPEGRNRLLAYMTTRSFGEYRPLDVTDCSCALGSVYDRKKCAINRRVEIIILGNVGLGGHSWTYLPTDYR